MNRRNLIVCLFWSFAFGFNCFAQQGSSTIPKARSPRALTIADADHWQSIRQFVLSPDGTWFGHLIMPSEGDGTLVIARTDDSGRLDDGGSEAKEKEEKPKKRQSKSGEDDDSAESTPLNRYEFQVGSASGQIRFSQDAKFAAWLQAPSGKSSKQKKEDSAPKNKAVLLNLETGQKVEFEKAQSISFSGENPKCLTVHKMKPKGRPGDDKGWDGTDLLIYDLQTGSEINVGNVKSFAFNKAGNMLAMLIDAQGKSGNGVQLLHVDSSRLEILDSGKFSYGAMSWTREGDAIALLKAEHDEEYENEHRHLLAFADVGDAKQKKIELNPSADPSIPENMTISPNRNPQWNDDRTAIFFGIQELEKKEETGSGSEKKTNSDVSDDQKGSKSEKSEEKDAGLVIWHWQDPRLQSMQQQQESREKRQFDLCVHYVENKTTLRLADEDIPRVSVGRPYKYAVGRDNRKYELTGNLDGKRLQDVYTIDLRSGKRKLVLEAARYVFDVGPDGNSLLYYKDEGHFYIYSMEDGSHTNITKNADVSFIDTEDDHNVTNPPQRPVGWSADGKYVLLSDGWDIWKLSVDGKEIENLTVNGKAEQIRYSNPHNFDPDVDGIDLSNPVYISAYAEWTKKAGFAQWSPGASGVEMLIWDDASFSSLNKLEDEPVYWFSRSTRKEPTSYHICGPRLADVTQLTDLSEQCESFKWSAGVRLINYTSSEGTRLQGALHLPANYIEGKKYPTIVYMYEKLSQTANRFDSPRTGGFSAAIYTSNGYAVFNPDIVFQLNDPGMSSKDCILAGLDAAVDSGVVDPKRVGLHGHSWGGYQTAFLITQTDRFKAAVAGAPLTNLISMYSSIYWNSGSANQPIFESSQGRFKGGYWDNLDAYARNSPVYFAERVNTPLLLLHNDEDGAVDWNQGIEYFNTLRRLGKPVVMLQYVGENHGVRKPENRKDYSYRMLDFFNHHLKDAKPPTWWEDGIKHLEMKDHIKDYRKLKTSQSSKQ